MDSIPFDDDYYKDIQNSEIYPKDDEYDEKFNEEELGVENNLNNIAYNNIENQINPISTSLNNKTTIFKTENKEDFYYKRTDDLRREVFFAFMIFLKSFLKETFSLNFDSFNCSLVLGKTIDEMRKVLELEIYQILCYYPENKAKIINFIKNAKVIKENRILFFYIMSRTYEELYNRYILGDLHFPLFKGGTVLYNSFTTLEKEIEKNKKKLQRKKDEKFIRAKMDAFESLSKNIISELKNAKPTEKEKKRKKEKNGKIKKEFIPEIIDKIEIWRNYFKKIAVSNGIGLEE